MASETSKSNKKTSVSRKQTKSAEPSLNIDEIREIADLVDERGFTDFEFENEKIRIRLSKTQPMISAPAAQAVPVQAVQQQTPQAQTAAPASEEKVAESSADADDDLHKITSPIVGTFYASPAPDKPSYVKEGDKVSEDTVVCIVEAMKLMNEIQAEVSGEIVKVYVENAQPVEFGQPLFGIKK